ncbi:MAG: hydroxyphenylacetyl-CoA thioesterase PaaI [Anaerolineales bacterium]|nr:hydroxyphenylacetyl-CoA thioesterase PaaI [Anaerolineales bacterium]
MVDPFMNTLGLQVESTAPGTACVRGRVRPTQLNMLGTAHGGFLFTMADIAFGRAANSHGVPAVALATHMEYLQPAKLGDELTATAAEVHLGRSTGLYRVDVRSGDQLIATFTGTVFRKQPVKESTKETSSPK